MSGSAEVRRQWEGCNVGVAAAGRGRGDVRRSQQADPPRQARVGAAWTLDGGGWRWQHRQGQR